MVVYYLRRQAKSTNHSEASSKEMLFGDSFHSQGPPPPSNLTYYSFKNDN